jgi:hypothetical protein
MSYLSKKEAEFSLTAARPCCSNHSAAVAVKRLHASWNDAGRGQLGAQAALPR